MPAPASFFSTIAPQFRRTAQTAASPKFGLDGSVIPWRIPAAGIDLVQ
jgi:hypothetical protein